MSAPLKKLCASVTPEVFDMARARQAELPYRSESDYVTALIVRDCRYRDPQPHLFALRLLNQRADLRAAELDQIARDFHNGVYPSEDLPPEEKMAHYVAQYLSHLPARVRAIKSGPKPATRRR